MNLVSRKFTVRDPKNNFDVDLPLSDYLLAIMIDRFQARTTKYVFSGDGKTGHLVETKRPMARLIEKTNQLLKIEHEELHQEIEFTAHDFRRTFSTMAHRAGIDPYTIKGLLNHLQKNDITGQYIQIPVEELSMPHARVNEFMLKNVKDKRMSTMR